jgi:hypothetical protein
VVILRYSVGQLAVSVVCGGVAAALMLGAFLYPENIAHIPRIRVLATGLGHTVITPALVLASLIVAWRAALIAVGDRKAIEATDAGLAVTGWWRRQTVRWADLTDARVTVHRKYKTPKLAVRARGWEVTLGLSSTEYGGMGEDALIDAILGARDRALGRAAPLAAPVPVRSAPVEPEPSGFDADAALASYLAKKQAGLLEAPTTRGFGRKGL